MFVGEQMHPAAFARFFQEKISEPPEPGWLELQWILSCPRVQDVHRATPSDSVLPSCQRLGIARRQPGGCSASTGPLLFESQRPELSIRLPPVLSLQPTVTCSGSQRNSLGAQAGLLRAESEHEFTNRHRSKRLPVLKEKRQWLNALESTDQPQCLVPAGPAKGYEPEWYAARQHPKRDPFGSRFAFSLEWRQLRQRIPFSELFCDEIMSGETTPACRGRVPACFRTGFWLPNCRPFLGRAGQASVQKGRIRSYIQYVHNSCRILNFPF